MVEFKTFQQQLQYQQTKTKVGSVDYGCAVEIPRGFADRREFNWNIMMVLKKLAEHVIKVELILRTNTAKDEAIRNVTRC